MSFSEATFRVALIVGVSGAVIAAIAMIAAV